MTDVTIGNGNNTADLTGSQGGTITVGNGNDTVVVTGGSGQTITVGNGNDSLTVDGATGDTIRAGNGNDTVTVSGGSGNTIVVGNGNETVAASGDHADTITVGNGNDTVDLGANDTATVGKGNDMLVLPPSSPTLAAPASLTVLEDNSIGTGILSALSATGFGQETIYGFGGNDKLEVSTAQFANFATLLADAKQVGQNTVISADPSDAITLENFQLSSLKSSNVVFTNGGSSATVSLTISGLPPDATLSSAADPGGVSYNATTSTWSVAAGALPDLKLNAGEVTTATLTVTATDSATGASISRTIALTVDPVAPTLTAPTALTVDQGQTVALNISETPYDVRDVVSLTIAGVPADATLSAGTRNADGTWTLTPAQLSGLTLTAGAATATSLTVTATNTLGITASTSDTIALTVTSPASIRVAISIPGGGGVQQGQSLLALATITGDAADLGAPVTYQWQSSSDGGQTWTNVTATAAGTFGGVAGSLYQLTEADEGKIFRAEASFTDDTGHLVSASSTPTVKVADVTPEITVPFSYAADDLSIVKNGTLIYNDTFSQAPPASPTILSNGTPTAIAYLTEGGTWRESGGKAVLSSSGATPNPAVAGGVYDFALLNTNTDPASNLGLKLATNFTVSSTFDLAAPTSGSYGMELTDGTPTHGTDQLERLVVARVNGNSVVELVQADLTTGTQTVVASHTLTGTELAGNTQIELALTHAANQQTVSGSFELIDNGTVTSTVDFAPTASIFTNGVDWTRVDIGAFTSEGVGLNVRPGQAIAAGETLSASAAANDADATIHYQWQKSGSAAFTTFTDIGTDSANYVVQAADAGSFIRVVATTNDTDSGQSATATSQVTGSVGLPSATPDFSGVFQDNLGDDSTSAVTGNVLSNDSGAIAGDQLHVSAVNGNVLGVGNAVTGAYGTLLLNADGSYSYQLADGQANVEGLSFGHMVTDTFSYTATDSFGTTTSSTVNIVIDPSNTAPVIVSAGTTATGSVTESPANVPETLHTVSGTVAFTDENLLDTHAPAIFVPVSGNYGNMSVTLDTDSTGGTTGTATWTYTVSDAALDPLAQGQTATDTFDVLIPDPNGGIANQPITITLTGSNDTPIVQSPDQNLVFTEGTASVFTASGTSSFTDVDLTDTHTVSASLQSATLSSGAPLPAGLTATLASALSATLQNDDSQFVPGQYGWNFALSNDAVAFLGQGEVLNLTYQIDTADPFGGVGVQDINVAITGVTAAPTITTPTVTGTAQEGQTLTASASAGASGASVTYAWYSSVDGYTNAIGTGASYLVQESDEGFTIEVKATAASSGGGASVSATSAATSPVLDAAPTVTTPIITGMAQEGQILMASASAGQPDNAVSYAWYSSADNFATAIATGATYQVREQDEGFTLEAKATVTNDDNVSISATSAATGPVLDAAPTVTTPVITGTAQEGQTLTVAANTGQPDNAVSYAWYSSDDNFATAIATGATYQVREQDEGFTLEAKATVTNDNSVSVSATSAATSPVLDAAPTVTTPVITGLAQEGQILTASANADQPDNAVSYAWYSSADNFATAIATGATYQVREQDEGFTLEAKVAVTNDSSVSVSATSAATVPVLDAAPTVTTPTITGMAQEGQILTVSASAGQPDNAVSYAWYSSADNFTNAIATGATYQVREQDEGFTIEAKATVTNDNNVSVSATSIASVPVLDAAPTVTTPVINGIAQEGQTLSVAASAGQPDNAVSYAWYSSADNFTNAIATGATYQVQERDEGFALGAKATVTNDDNVSVSATSAATGPVLDAAPTVTTPVITGIAQEGQTLSVAASTGDADDTVSYAWYSSADNFTNAIATGATYQVQEKDEGATLEAKATVTNDNGITASATSATTAPVTDDASVSVTVSVLGNGTAQQGQILVAAGTITGDADDLSAPISYQWQTSSNGGQTWTNVAATTTGTINGVVSSLYQLGEGDEGNIFRAVASITDETGQVVSAASAPTAKVADVPAVLSVPFSYAVDDFKVVRNGSLLGDDNFSNGPPPIAGVFSGTPVAFATNTSTGSSTWSEANGKAIMSSSGAISGGNGALVQAILLTNTSPEGTGTGQSNSGLKENATFTVSATFDLATPPPAGSGGYGIMLTNTAPGVAATEVVELEVQRSTSGTANVVLLQVNQATGTSTVLANQVFTQGQMAGNNEIELDLAHNTVNTSTITGSFELFNNGVETQATTFAPSTQAHAFTNQTFTRADIFATSAAAAQVSGTAQEGQTLTALVSANDSDAVLAYQWQTSSDGGTTWSSISGATSSTYVVQDADEGNKLRVSVSSSDTDGTSASVVSGATAQVIEKAPSVTISGTPQEGQTLAASATADADDSVSYAWFSSQSNFTIQIGTGATYVPQEADEGFNIEVKATATDANGLTASATSTPTAAVLDAAPTVTIPTISGIAQEGQTLTASASAGDPDDTITYTWYTTGDNDTNPIGFGSTLVVPESADALTATSPGGLIKVVDLRTIEVKATVTNENGVSVSAVSAQTPGIADAAPAFLVSPTITGTAQEGQTLSAFAAAEQSDNPVTYAWYSGGTEVGTDANYVVQESDEGSAITVVATVTNEQGQTVSETSDPTALVGDAAPQFAGFPTITNPLSPMEGETLVASATPAQSDNTVTYAWYSSADDFTNPIGTGDSYTLQESDEAAVIAVKATITNDDGETVSAISNTTGIVGDAPATVDTPTITGIAQEGQVLTAAASATQDADDSPLIYLWYSSRDGFTGPIAAGPTYLVQETDEGSSIGVRAIAYNEYAGIMSQGSVTSSLATVGIPFDVDDSNPNQPDNDPSLNGKIVDGHQYFNVSNSNIVLAADATVIGLNNVITPDGATVTLAPSSGNVIEGDEANIVASLATFDLTGDGDNITGSSDNINAAANTAVNLDGALDTVNGDGITVNASNTFVTLTGAGDQLDGQNDIVVLAGNAADVTINGDAQAIIYAPNVNLGQLTLNGSNDVVSAPTNTQINLQDFANLIVVNGGANDVVTGNNVTINGQVNGLTLNGSGDTVEGFSNIINLPDGSGVMLENVGGFTTIFGNNEQINVPDPNTGLVLMGTGDVVNGDSAVVQMPNGGTATLLGDNDQAYGSNDILYVDNESIGLGPISGGTNPLVGATIVGSNDQITMPVQDPTTQTSLTVQGNNDLLMGRGEAITIADGASIKYITTSGTTVTFAGPTGTLELDGPGSFDPPEQNTVVGFGGQDQIDIGGLVYTPNVTTVSYLENGDRTGGTLTVSSPGASSSILLFGDYTTQNFALASDGHGGTLVTDPPSTNQAQLAPSHA